MPLEGRVTTIYIDNLPYGVKDGQNLLQASLTLGFNLPYFCWHPALHSVGACRQCAVKVFKDESDTRGRLAMGCMTPATEGTRLSIEDPEAKAFRAGVIEWLMLNHPHDCPICDEGGECHLQDMTVMSGHNYRRSRFRKRTHLNQNLGPFLNHEMNRCIQCYRCVRFYRDYSGGRDFNVFASHDSVYFGRYEDGALESPFSGNLVEVCPTGVFTDKPFKEHPTRKWDLQTAPSVCTGCSLGCNIIVAERYGEVRRVLNRYNADVNRYFLCDRGRYGFDFVNSQRRLRLPLVDGRELVPEGSATQALSATEGGSPRPAPASSEAKGAVVRRAVARARDILHGSRRAIGIGSPRASVESNYALRSLVGPDNFCDGMTSGEHRLVGMMKDIVASGPVRSLSLAEVERADVVLVLGEDVVNTAPLLDLALRQAVRTRPEAVAEQLLRIPLWDDRAKREATQGKQGPLFVATPYPVSIDDIAVKSYRLSPDDIARLAQAVAYAIDPEGIAPLVGAADPLHVVAETIGGSLGLAARPLVIAGASLGSEAILRAAANVATALAKAGKKDAGLFLVAPEANSMGSALLGGMSLDEALEAVRTGGADTVVVVENDLTSRLKEASFRALFDSTKHSIVLDFFRNRTTELAEIVLPVATFAESSGTFVNNEGRAQRFFEVVNPDEIVSASWKWLGLLSGRGTGEEIAWDTLDDIIARISEDLPALAAIGSAAPGARDVPQVHRVPRDSHRVSGRTANVASLTVHEPPPPRDLDTPLSYSMEGSPRGRIPSSLIARIWAPRWNSVQALTRFQEEVGGPLKGGDPGALLFGPASDRTRAYFDGIPEAFAPDPRRPLAVAIRHVFGSEPLSALSRSVSERIPSRYVGITPDAARSLAVADGERVEVTVRDLRMELPVRIMAGLAEGLCALPEGLPDMPYVGLPAPAGILKRSAP